jgi:hypothetical protein
MIAACFGSGAMSCELQFASIHNSAAQAKSKIASGISSSRAFWLPAAKRPNRGKGDHRMHGDAFLTFPGDGSRLF